MGTTLRCVAKRMNGGQGHEHIESLWWVKYADGQDVGPTVTWTRAQMVAYIEQHGENSVWCPDRNPSLKGAWVHVHNNGHIKFVQTVADGRKTDNLLALPDR
ncbi:DUF3892 domain-containing protein [Ralstonia pseudosolanacearum]|uniref:DUF3892 domain-containing protein n=1 Tax=Ralstonia pseudosolanacearum TaxID=1310165 RepID=UPI003CFB3155